MAGGQCMGSKTAPQERDELATAHRVGMRRATRGVQGQALVQASDAFQHPTGSASDHNGAHRWQPRPRGGCSSPQFLLFLSKRGCPALMGHER